MSKAKVTLATLARAGNNTKPAQMLANGGYSGWHDVSTILPVTPEILAAALRAYRAAKAQFMLSDEEASRMIAEAVLQAAS